MGTVIALVILIYYSADICYLYYTDFQLYATSG